jgi:predicted signal transduction protein with EAL and GGDEF domain
MRQDGDDVESLLERADQAMYDAKLNGRNRVCVYAERVSTNTHANSRLHVVERRDREH